MQESLGISDVLMGGQANLAAAEARTIGFEYLGLSNPFRFFVERIEKNKAVLRVNRVFMGAETCRACIWRRTLPNR
jgi:hypothetical protein